MVRCMEVKMSYPEYLCRIVYLWLGLSSILSFMLSFAIENQVVKMFIRMITISWFLALLGVRALSFVSQLL